MTHKSFKATVHGVVQGVCFRYYTRQTAERLGVAGWVKNQPDGTVAVAAYGEEAALRPLATWLGTGPPSARVSRVEVAWSDEGGTGACFKIVH